MPLMVRRHAALWPAIVTGVLWLALTVAVSQGATLRFDRWVHAHTPTLSLAEIVTYAGDPVVMLLFAVTLVTVLARLGERDAARFVAGSFVAVALFRWAIVWQLERERPEGGLMAAFGYSYPSGHTAYAATVAMVTFLLIGHRGWLAVALAAWPAVVGATRIAVGVHWASDVIGGMLLAIAVMSVVCLTHQDELTAQGYQAKTVRRQPNSLRMVGKPVEIRR